MSMPLAADRPLTGVSAPEPDAPAKPPLARLAALHREAEETSQLANLLGRSIQAAAALALMACAVVLFAGPQSAQAAAWITFVGAAAGAIGIIYRSAILRPFERPALVVFSRDFRAAMLFAGAAWGSGAFLVLPPAANIAAVVLFVTGAATIVALILRERDSTMFFLAPAALMVAAASILKPLAAGDFGAIFVLIACAALGVSVAAGSRFVTRATEIGDLTGMQQG
ncbi:MAG: hypothetical protein JO261_01975 [Alphaproteobacteria bacterium]|nr:hypothetical protein [Alphaproteobacteria bacterium]MBV9692447.1 hypothetical protein [Alphaproteobacteria bacterium]